MRLASTRACQILRSNGYDQSLGRKPDSASSSLMLLRMKHVTIGLIGLGTVGTGVARLLTEHADRIARRAGRRVRWTWAAVRDLEKPRDCPLGRRLADDRCV